MGLHAANAMRSHVPDQGELGAVELRVERLEELDEAVVVVAARAGLEDDPGLVAVVRAGHG